MSEVFDVIVVGGGPAGENAAGRCRRAGLTVALVERELVGGECSYWGCIPSKTLIRPGDVVAAAKRAPGAAEAVTGPVDAAAAFAQRDYMTSNWSDGSQVRWLDGEGITLVRGTGRLAGPRAVEVEGRVLAANRAVVLSTGTSAVLPPIPGLADARPWDNRDATGAKAVPRRLIVLGGGAIGTELAQAFRRLGSAEVTVIEGADRLLIREEPFAGAEVKAAFEAEGMAVVTGHRVTAVSRDGAEEPGGPVVATLDDGRTFVADEILVAAGRRPATAALGLETIGLADKAGRFLDTDDRLRVLGVEGEWLYAIGDCNGRALLTHMGKYHGRIVGDVIAGLDIADRASRGAVPRVTFTDPQVAAVGLTEAEARAAGLPVRTVSVGTGDVPGAYTQGNGITGTSHLVVDQERRVIVGATFTGPGVQELLHAATVALVGEVTLDTLWHAVASFPTLSEVWLHLLQKYGV